MIAYYRIFIFLYLTILFFLKRTRYFLLFPADMLPEWRMGGETPLSFTLPYQKYQYKWYFSKYPRFRPSFLVSVPPMVLCSPFHPLPRLIQFPPYFPPNIHILPLAPTSLFPSIFPLSRLSLFSSLISSLHIASKGGRNIAKLTQLNVNKTEFYLMWNLGGLFVWNSIRGSDIKYWSDKNGDSPSTKEGSSLSPLLSLLLTTLTLTIQFLPIFAIFYHLTNSLPVWHIFLTTYLLSLSPWISLFVSRYFFLFSFFSSPSFSSWFSYSFITSA